MGALCDAAGCSAALCASTIILLLGGILCVTARSISESPSRIMWFLTIARGIIGVVRELELLLFCYVIDVSSRHEGHRGCLPFGVHNGD